MHTSQKILKLGSKGDEVKLLQKKLGIKIDGTFAKDTKEKLIEWQKINNLTPDGIVGPNTWNKIMLDDSIMITNTVTNLQSQNISYKSSIWDRLKFENNDTSQVTNIANEVSTPINEMPEQIDLEVLRIKEKLQPYLKEKIISQISFCADKFKINTTLRMAHFLGQCHHESGGFKLHTENLNYSRERLLKLFPAKFQNIDITNYVGHPSKIGARIYANRMGNGNEESGEGFKFRGRGYIQLTGKNHYTEFSKAIGNSKILENPDIVATTYPLISAAWYWHSKSLNQVADQGIGDDIITIITKKVNGGYHGIEERKKYSKLYYEFCMLLTPQELRL